MINSFDYKEPQCVLCGGKEFYNPSSESPDGRIPVDRIIFKVDSLFNKNDYVEAGRVLEYWLGEAELLKDKSGELSILSELIGYYRKTNNKEKCFFSIIKALQLVEELGQANMASGATIFLNCATAYKAFGEPQKAIELYKQSESIYSSILSPDDERFGGLYNNMALALVDLDHYKEAEVSYLKAVSIMKNIPNGQADLAITYVNMAHLFELKSEKKNITECMFSAYNLLNSEKINRNGYFAYVCQKCAPSFEYFGYKIIADELTKLSGEIYERS